MGKRNKRVAGRFSTITSCISTTMVLILLGAVVFFVLVANNFGRDIRQNFCVEVLVSDSVNQAQLYDLQTDLRREKYTIRTNYVSKEKSSAEMAASPDAAIDNSFLDHNPLPQEFEVYMKADYVNKDSLSQIIPQLLQKRGVIDVLYPQEEIQDLDRIIPRVSLVLLSIAVLLAFVSFALINTTIRLTVYSRRFAIHTMKLVGASWGFIRRPFLLNALLVGCVSAIIASSLMGAGMYYLYQQNNYITSLVTPEVVVVTIGTIIICGLLMTFLCAFFSVNRYLRMSESDMYMR